MRRREQPALRDRVPRAAALLHSQVEGASTHSQACSTALGEGRAAWLCMGDFTAASLFPGLADAGRWQASVREVETVAARFGRLLPAGALADAGLSHRAVQALRQHGLLRSIRRGIYVAGNHWDTADADERYRLLVRATALLAGRPPVLSHHSAAVLHGLPIIGPWPTTVHTLVPAATGGSTARFTTSHRGYPPGPVETIAGCTVTSLARTLVDVASTSSFVVGVTMIDHALRVAQERPPNEAWLTGGSMRPPLTSSELVRELEMVNPRAGFRRAERAIAFANPLSANPGETLSRVRIFQLGFEVPELQVCFPDVLGGNAYADFFWRRVRKIGEFDGFLKYGAGLVRGDRDPGSVVWQEKQREDALRARVNSFDRWGWDDALSPERFGRFLHARGVPRA